MKEQADSAADPYDWEHRRLCPDESCIGIIGPDGRCTECGRRADPEDFDAPADGSETSGGAELSDTEGEVDAAGSDPVSDKEVCPPADDEWQSRRLCPDGNCIGVIGPDGRCNICGRRAES